MRKRKPKLAVWKFTSCDGCQLTLLDSRAEFLTLFSQIELAYFPEATSASLKGPFDLSLVEGSISTPDEAERIRAVRQSSNFVVTMGACASAGGLQALRNFSDVEEFAGLIYPLPQHVQTLKKATPVCEHVAVDFEVRGCPVSQSALQEVIKAFLYGEPLPKIPEHSVCMECKKRGIGCLMRQGIACMGPLTYPGCGALCPSYNRGCAGCYGPQDNARPEVLARYWRELGVAEAEITSRVFRGINAYAQIFREGANKQAATWTGEVTGEPQ